MGSTGEERMRNILRTSAVLALGMLGGLAAASDYIVARSTDASIVKGTRWRREPWYRRLSVQ